LLNNYEIEHTLSINEAVDDVVSKAFYKICCILVNYQYNSI